MKAQRLNNRIRLLQVALLGFVAMAPLHTSVDEAWAAPTVSVSAVSATAEAGPIDELRTTLDKVVDAVERLPGESNIHARRAELRQIIQPNFDFDEMARRSLGAYWDKISADQQKEFISVFSDLLASTYLGRIETVKRGMVKIEREKVEFPRAIVRTNVTAKGETFPIDYKLMSQGGKWRVYDVVIENIGLVANYRNEFAGIIRKEEFAGLMDRLREKAKKLA